MGFLDDLGDRINPKGRLDDLDWLTGDDAQKDAKKANEKNLKKNLQELDDLLPLLEEYFARGQAALQSGYGKARRVMGGYLEEGAQIYESAIAEFDNALTAVDSGYDDAQQQLGAQAGVLQQAALTSQQQAMASAGQGLYSRGLANTSVGTAVSRGIQGDTARALGQGMAAIGQQRSQLAMQQGAARAGIMQNRAGMMGQSASFQAQSAGMMGQLDLGYGKDLASLLQHLSSQRLQVAGMKSSARAGVQHVAGPSPLSQFSEGAQAAAPFM